jgi:hypothetical protein
MWSSEIILKFTYHIWMGSVERKEEEEEEWAVFFQSQ